MGTLGLMTISFANDDSYVWRQCRSDFPASQISACSSDSIYRALKNTSFACCVCSSMIVTGTWMHNCPILCDRLPSALSRSRGAVWWRCDPMRCRALRQPDPAQMWTRSDGVLSLLMLTKHWAVLNRHFRPSLYCLMHLAYVCVVLSVKLLAVLTCFVYTWILPGASTSCSLNGTVALFCLCVWIVLFSVIGPRL